MSYKKDFIAFMVRSKVLTFGDFTTKSGRQTPFFINTGNYQTGEQICLLGEYYAECIYNNLGDRFDVLYGPAYKGIPLSIAVSIALYKKFGLNKAFCFNRKEAKDHGEGGSLIGHIPKGGERIVIIEDVITAGTSVRESVPLLKKTADVKIAALIISVDRMEKGLGSKTALQEIKEEFGINAFSLVTIRDIVQSLSTKKVDNSELIAKIESYLAIYGA
jgi:orotate phosphoribosyltransferase